MPPKAPSAGTPDGPHGRYPRPAPPGQRQNSPSRSATSVSNLGRHPRVSGRTAPQSAPRSAPRANVPEGTPVNTPGQRQNSPPVCTLGRHPRSAPPVSTSGQCPRRHPGQHPGSAAEQPPGRHPRSAPPVSPPGQRRQMTLKSQKRHVSVSAHWRKGCVGSKSSASVSRTSSSKRPS